MYTQGKTRIRKRVMQQKYQTATITLRERQGGRDGEKPQLARSKNSRQVLW